MDSRPEPAVVTTTTARIPAGVRTAVLVEGDSDEAAVTIVAARRRRDLAAEGIAVVPMGGVTNIGHFVRLLGPGGLGVTLAGLYDSGEEHVVRRALARAGLGAAQTRVELARLGFFACVEDLEAELIRTLGIPAVEQIIAAAGELRSLQTLRRQPAQRGWTDIAILRRFIGSRSHRKLRYATLLAGALDPATIPAPLDDLLTHLAPAG
ncbi:TOPRIM nucleotidyl transferase/hydrolase domain-containing protein [Actinocatenispora sera]|uniref:TOPRIM nucleotidyl transferase/hydrolase domain-containing protein n=1 Tax=Actinocatenispora sera TaxID=390989 RepID=UPI00340BBC0C